MERSEIVVALLVALVAAVVLALGDNDLVLSAVAVVAVVAIVLVYARLEERHSRWLYLTVPVWALVGGGLLSLVPRLLDLAAGIRIATFAVGAVIGTLMRIAELGERRTPSGRSAG